jgi:hypothetical protein
MSTGLGGIARILGTAPGKVRKMLVQRFPGEPVFKPDVTSRWKRFGNVERCSRHINRVRAFVVLIRQ